MEFLAIGLLICLGWLLRKPPGQQAANMRPFWAFLGIIIVGGAIIERAI